MKTSYMFIAFAWLTSLAGIAAATSTRSAKAMRFAKSSTEVNGISPAEAFAISSSLPKDAAVDTSAEDSKAAAEHQTLLLELKTKEHSAEEAKRAMVEEQRILVATMQEQQLLEARMSKLEASEAALEARGDNVVVVEKGIVKNGSEQSPIVKSAVADATGKEAVDSTTGPLEVTQTEKQFWDEQNKGFFNSLVGVGAYVALMMLAGVLYMQFMDKSDPALKVPPYLVRVDEFQYGPFDCEGCQRDWQLCFCSWCFGWVRWADTASNPQVDFLKFCPAIGITALLSSSSSITFGATMPILLLIVVLCRQRIRVAYGLPNSTFSVLAWDCCLWLWCPCCAIAQEARQVEYVESGFMMEGNDKIKGPYQRAPFQSYQQQAPYQQGRYQQPPGAYTSGKPQGTNTDRYTQGRFQYHDVEP